MIYLVWKDQMYSPIRDVVEEIDGNVFFHDADGEKCIADRANIPYIAQSEQDAKRFLGIHTNLPLIPDYAKTSSRHSNLLDEYNQWLKVVAQWGYDIMEVYDGYQVWSIAYYQWLWDEHSGWYLPEQGPKAIKV
jgi:hypothetical protein